MSACISRTAGCFAISASDRSFPTTLAAFLSCSQNSSTPLEITTETAVSVRVTTNCPFVDGLSQFTRRHLSPVPTTILVNRALHIKYVRLIELHPITGKVLLWKTFMFFAALQDTGRTIVPEY